MSQSWVVDGAHEGVTVERYARRTMRRMRRVLLVVAVFALLAFDLFALRGIFIK